MTWEDKLGMTLLMSVRTEPTLINASNVVSTSIWERPKC
jgi:hypothetical protein